MAADVEVVEGVDRMGDTLDGFGVVAAGCDRLQQVAAGGQRAFAMLTPTGLHSVGAELRG